MKTLNKLAILDIAWLKHIQEARQISEETLRGIGVPERYADMDARVDRDAPFRNVVLVSGGDSKSKAKDVLTDYIVAGLDNCQPGVSFYATTFLDLVTTLTAHKTEKAHRQQRVNLYTCDCLFIYDFGMYHLRDWEMKEVAALVMSRYNSLQHISMAAEDISPALVAKHVGPATWGVLKRYCDCREVS